MLTNPVDTNVTNNGELANNAQLAADEANKTGSDNNIQIKNINDPNYLSPFEKPQLEIQMDNFATNYAADKDIATSESIDFTAYDAAYQAYLAYMTPLIADMTTYSPINRDTYNSMVTAVQAQQTAFDSATKAQYDTAINQAKTDIANGQAQYQIMQTDAANMKSDAANVATTASQAIASAGFANDTANAAQSSAMAAVNQAGFASDTSLQASQAASSAVATANEAAAGVTVAKSDAANALTSAATAFNAANGARDSAGVALDNAKSALDKVNGLQFGGRNLILNSANLSGFPTWAADGNKPTTTADGSEMTIVTKHGGLNINSANLSKNLPNVGDTVTISVEAKGTATLQFNYQNGNGYVGPQQFTVTDEYKRYFAQYTWDPINASVNQQFVIFTNDSTDTTLIIKNPKLEVGNVATDWTPAPEDVQVQISDINGELSSKASKDTYDTLAGTVDQVSTLSKQNQSALVTKADSQTVDTLKQRVTTAENALTQTATKTELEQTNTDVDKLNNTVKSSSSEITAQAGKIDGLLSSTTDINGKLTTLQSNFDLSSQQLSTTMSTVDGQTTSINDLKADSNSFKSQFTTVNDTLGKQTTDIGTLQATSKELTTGFNTLTTDNTTNKNDISQLKQTATEVSSTLETVQTQVDNSAVGTNLLLKTYESFGMTGNNTVNQTQPMYALSRRLEAGTTVTLSFDAVSTAPASFGILSNGSDGGAWTTYVSNTVDTTARHYVGTIAPTNFSDLGITMRLDNVPSTTTITVSNVKLEIGSNATDYSTNPLDNATVTAVSKLSQTVDGMKTDISKKIEQADLNGYATETWAQNQIKMTADGINGTISSVKSTVDGHTTSINGLQADSKGFKAQFQTVNDTLGKHTTDIGTLQSDAKSLSSNFNSLNTDNNTNKNDISELKQTATEVSSTISKVDSLGQVNLVYNSGYKNNMDGWNLLGDGYTSTVPASMYQGSIGLGTNYTGKSATEWTEFAESKHMPLPSTQIDTFSNVMSYGAQVKIYGETDKAAGVQVCLSFYNASGTRVTGYSGSTLWVNAVNYGQWYLASGVNVPVPADAVTFGIQYWGYGTAVHVMLAHPMIVNAATLGAYVESTIDLATVTDLTQVKQTADGAQALATNNHGDITSLQETAEGLQSTVSDKVSSDQLTQLSDQLTNKISDLSSSTSSQFTQTFKDINGLVKKGDVVNQLNIDAGGILLDTSGSTAKIILSSNNIELDSANPVVMGSANITNLLTSKTIEASSITSTTKIIGSDIQAAMIHSADNSFSLNGATGDIIGASIQSSDGAWGITANGKISGASVTSSLIDISGDGSGPNFDAENVTPDTATGIYSRYKYTNPNVGFDVNGMGRKMYKNGYLVINGDTFLNRTIGDWSADGGGKYVYDTMYEANVIKMRAYNYTGSNVQTDDPSKTQGVISSRLDIQPSAITMGPDFSVGNPNILIDYTGRIKGGLIATNAFHSIGTTDGGDLYFMKMNKDATNVGGSSIPIHVKGLYTSNLGINNGHTISSFDGGGIYVKDDYGGNGHMVDLHVKKLYQSSLLSLKTDIKPIDPHEALTEVVKNDVMGYHFKNDKTTDPKSVSVILDDINPIPKYYTSDIFKSADGTGRNDGNIVGYLMLSIKDLNSRLQKLEGAN